jgi:outer membrane protein assembly factor BamB
VRQALVLLSGFVVALAPAHPWACFHGDAQHTGCSVNVVGSPLALAEAFACDTGISGSPVIRRDGMVLVGSRGARLYCLAPDLDSVAWVADLTPYGSNIYYSTPALDDSDNAYITTNRKLVKVSGGGTALWSWPSNNSLSISHSPVIGQDGKIYFAGYSDSIYALNPGGTLAWAQPLANSVNSAPVVDLEGNILVATTRGSAPWYLRSFFPDGGVHWHYQLDGDAEYATPAVGPDGTIYVGADRYLYAVRSDCVLRWRDSLTARIQSCPAIANESTLYVVAGTRLYCIDSGSTVRWRRSIGGSDNYSSPVVDAEGNVYVANGDGANSTLYCFAPDSTLRDSHIFSDDVWSSPAIGEKGRVYVGSMNDSLYLLQGPGPAVAEPAQRPGPASIRLLPNPTSGVVRIAPSGRYSVKVFDACGALVAATSNTDGADLSGLRSGVYMVQVAGGPPRKLVLR